MNIFAYLDETDKSFGITGMILSLFAMDNQSMLRAVSMDSPDSESVEFSPEFFFTSNPRMSARTTWNELMQQFQLLTAMSIGNVVCRHTIHYRRNIPADRLEGLHRTVMEEGTDACSLEADEIDTIYNKILRYQIDFYNNPRVASIASHLSAELRSRRHLSAGEIFDELHSLGLA